MPTFNSLAHVPDHVLEELVHELRQPLSNIGLSASYLGMILGENQGRAQDQVRKIQEQVERAAAILTAVTAELNHTREH